MEKLILAILVLIGITGVLNGFFLFFYLLNVYAKKNSPDKYLAFLVLFLTIRMAKSVITSIVIVPFTVIHVGLAAFAGVGPLLYLYLIRSSTSNSKLTYKELLHFIPSILVLLCNLLPYPQNNAIWDLRYNLIMLQIFIYLIISTVYLHRKISNNEVLPYSKSWYIFVIVAITLIWLTYGITWWLGVLPYLSGTFLFCLFVYMILFLWLKKRELNESFEKYKNSHLSKSESSTLYAKLLQLMEQSKPYLDNEITLAKLSALMGIKSHSLSQVINENNSMNFFDFINSYRIDEIKKRLVSPAYSNFTIAAIAYDCGFNSISSFNSAFRKKEKISPSKFRESFL